MSPSKGRAPGPAEARAQELVLPSEVQAQGLALAAEALARAFARPSEAKVAGRAPARRRARAAAKGPAPPVEALAQGLAR
ncbi:MAG TPA: hypothetical protein VF886_00200, partial [Roseiarcus sp.]